MEYKGLHQNANSSLTRFNFAVFDRGPHLQSHENSSEVDPMLGADRGGNVFVGPTLPFGMAKPGPDYGDDERKAHGSNMIS